MEREAQRAFRWGRRTPVNARSAPRLGPVVPEGTGTLSCAGSGPAERCSRHTMHSACSTEASRTPREIRVLFPSFLRSVSGLSAASADSLGFLSERKAFVPTAKTFFSQRPSEALSAAGRTPLDPRATDGPTPP